MAKERYSNETLARVLLKNTENLEEKLEIHTKKMTELMAKPILIDSSELKKTIENFNDTQRRITQEYLKLISEKENKFNKITKGLPKWYLYVNLSMFMGLFLLGWVLYAKIQKQEEINRWEQVYKGVSKFLEDNPNVEKQWNEYWDKKRNR